MTSNHGGVNELTPRQRQILALIQEGKVNKEVARSLGIEEGTVKQHVVAIFKKLHVSNRTMAIQKWQAYQQALQAEGRHSLSLSVSDAAGFRSQLERRPCVVIAFRLSPFLEEEDRGAFLSTLAELAAHFQALFISRQSEACELVLGVSRIYDYQASVTIQLLERFYSKLIHTHPYVFKNVKVAIHTGLVIASVDRFGGWTEEVIASPLIAQARGQVQQVTVGRIFLSTSFISALEHDALFIMPVVMDQLLRWSEIAGLRFVFLEKKVALSDALTLKDSARYLLVASLGYGKTQALSSFYEQYYRDKRVLWLQFLPEVFHTPIRDCGKKQTYSFEDGFAVLETLDTVDLLLLDDMHYLSLSHQQRLLTILLTRFSAATIVVSATHPLKLFTYFDRLHLPVIEEERLLKALFSACPDVANASRTLIDQWLCFSGGSLGLLQSFCACRFNPEDSSSLAWHILSSVAADLDSYPLDRCLLKQISSQESGSEIDWLVDTFKESFEYVEDALQYLVDLQWLNKNEAISGFDVKHPLVKLVVRYLMVHHMMLGDISS